MLCYILRTLDKGQNSGNCKKSCDDICCNTSRLSLHAMRHFCNAHSKNLIKVRTKYAHNISLSGRSSLFLKTVGSSFLNLTRNQSDALKLGTFFTRFKFMKMPYPCLIYIFIVTFSNFKLQTVCKKCMDYIQYALNFSGHLSIGFFVSRLLQKNHKNWLARQHFGTYLLRKILYTIVFSYWFLDFLYRIKQNCFIRSKTQSATITSCHFPCIVDHFTL